MSGIRAFLLCVLATAALVLVACGGDGETTAETETQTTETTAGGACGPIEEVDVELTGTHQERKFTLADYETNPPAGGDHSPTPLEAGRFYTDPPPLGEAVHLLEHGAVIGWTNGLSAEDQKAVEDAFNDVFQDGYYQLAVVELPELDGPFALSAWGAVQNCDGVDTEAIRPFIEEWYASSKTAEGGLACEGDARRLPNC